MGKSTVVCSAFAVAFAMGALGNPISVDFRARERREAERIELFKKMHPRMLVLAKRGAAADCTVVVPAAALPAERYAADELTNFVARMTGVQLPVVTDATALPAKAVVLGKTRHTPADCLPKDEPSGDAFRLVAKGGRLYVGGKKRGVLYGVYELLERFGGCRWYASWCEKIPQAASFAVPADLVDEQSPAFLMREPFWYDVCKHRDFAARIRVNGYNHTPNDVPAKVGGDDYRFGGGLPSCHTFNTLCDPHVYFDTHPEYFSLVNGTRRKDHTQLCLTNPDVLEIVTSNVLARIRKDPDAKFYGVSQNDWYNYCECPKCKAVDDEEESHAGTMVRFVNAVAERVEKEFPDAIVETLAYQYTRKPPKITKLRHNVVPCLCTIECDFSRPLTESKYKQNVSFLKDIVGWSAQTDGLYVWDYVTNFRRYTMPHANFDALQGNVKCFRDNGVKYLFEQGGFQGRYADFAELKAWLLAKWTWNPELPEKPLLDDFFDGYYGKAAPFVRDWFEELRAAQRAWSDDPERPLLIYEKPDYAGYSDALLERGATLLAKAAEAVRGDAVRAGNVRACAFSIDCMRLERLRKTMNYDLWLSDEPFDLARWRRTRDLARSIVATLREVPEIRLAEGGSNEDMNEAWPAIATNPPPPIVVGAKAGTVGASRFEGNNPACKKAIVPCAGTQDGKALAFFDTPWDWCGRYYLYRCRFQPGVSYRFRVRMKVEKATEEIAFRAGVRISDAGDKKVDRIVRTFKASETSADWKWYDVGACVPGPDDFFFVGHAAEATAKNRAGAQKIFVDCVEIARDDVATAAGAREVRYVANAGNDAADGKTPATAWRTIEKLNADLPAGATARFKCGDVFYGGATPKAGPDAAHPTVLTSYGAGAKPVISCTKNLKNDPAIWEPVNASYGFWRTALTNEANYGGIRAADANPGFLLVDGEVKPWKKYVWHDVNQPWDFCGQEGWLYVYATANPARLAKSIRVAVNVHAVRFHSNVVVSNLAVHATGAHGMVGGWDKDEIVEHVRISDCDFVNVGGSELGMPEAPSLTRTRTRYGNGVELGSNCRDAIVERCSFKGVYDVAFTMQGYPTLTGWRDVHVRDCTMVDCTQAFEIWCARAPKGMGYERCSFTGNRTLRVGGGWGAESRPNRCTATPLLVYGMDTDTVDVDVSGNTFEDMPRGLLHKSGGLEQLPSGYRVHDNVVRGLGADDTVALQQLLNKGGRVTFKKGNYVVSRPLVIGGDTTLVCEKGATIRLADGANCAILVNRETKNGFTPNVAVEGGVWDGNNVGQDRSKYVADGWSWGQLVVFAGVSNLTLRGMTVKDPNSFGIQLTDVVDFVVRDVTFDCNDKTFNQDGVHVNGFARNGKILNLRGHTNDDMVALNADEGIFRSPDCTIENVLVDGVHGGTNGWTAIRLLSRDAMVRDVTIRNVTGRYKFNVVSFTHWAGDAWRPGMGHFENVLIEDVEAASCRKTGTGHGGLVWFQPGVQSAGEVTVRRFDRVEDADQLNATHTVDVDGDAAVRKLTLEDVRQRVPGGKPLMRVDSKAKVGELVRTRCD